MPPVKAVFYLDHACGLLFTDFSTIDEEKFKDSIFYKEIPVDNDKFYERLIVTYSIKCRNYMRNIREGQVVRAEKALKNGEVRAKKNANDFKRFIKKECYDIKKDTITFR